MKKKLLSWLTIGACSLYLLWRLFFTLPLDLGIVALIGGILLFIAEFFSTVEAMINLKCMSGKKEIEKPVVPDNLLPDVDVLIATHSEETELLRKTVNGCLHMEYPDRSKVHIYLCDDANRPEIRQLALDMGVGCFQLEKNAEAKAGNLNNALRNTKSPLIVTFDADMIPREEFLKETVPYFFLPKMIQEEDGSWRMRTEEEMDENFKMGFVQTPQNFYNPDLFQFNFGCEDKIPDEQDYFFKEVNVGRNATNTPIYAGSNTMITRQSLEEVGYIHTNNITEDFATGIDIQARGYTCLAVSEVLASGLAPNDFGQLIQQRQRWGRGCVQTLMSKDFWASKLPFWSKMSYVNCLSYWWTFARRAVFIMAPILFVLFDLVLIKTSFKELLFIWLPSYLIFNHAIKSLSGKIRVNRWSNIVDTIMFPYLIFPILCETLGLSLRKFAVTDKGNTVKRNTSLKYAIPHGLLLAATVLGLVKSVSEILVTGNFQSAFVVFWLLSNGYYLLMAVLFMTGRINFRRSERYKTELGVYISGPFFDHLGITTDISELGFCCCLKSSRIPEIGKTVRFEMKDNEIYTSVYGKIVRLYEKDGERYACVELEESATLNLDWLHMIYGKKATLPEYVRSNALEEFLAVLSVKTGRELRSSFDKKEKDTCDQQYWKKRKTVVRV